MRSSLDDFQRYIAKQEKVLRDGADTVGTDDRGSDRAASAVVVEEAPLGVTAEVQYILRGGITVAVPTGSPPATPANNTVADEVTVAVMEAPVDATDDDPSMLAQAALWQRLPRHIQLLVRIADDQVEEAAQKYYTRGFKESRRQLIERLLDPTLTLEDTARVLGVVPATVRRYTNRGALPHYRTVGQQRRFRLSDVLAFLEAQQNGRDSDGGQSDA